MPPTLLRHPGQKPPVGPLRLDPGNPLTNRIAMVAVLNEMGSASVNDTVKGIGQLQQGAVWDNGLNAGPSVKFAKSGGSRILFSGPSEDIAAVVPNLTIVCRCHPTVFGNTEQEMVSKGDLGTPTPSWGFHLSQYFAADGKLVFSFNNGSWTDLIGSAGVTLNKTVTAAMVLRGGVDWRSYIDGVLDNTVTVGVPASLNANSRNLAVGSVQNYAGDNPTFDGYINYVYLWLRALSGDEIAQITAEPFQIFQQRPVQRWAVIPAAGGGGAGLPFFMQDNLMHGGMADMAGGKQ